MESILVAVLASMLVAPEASAQSGPCEDLDGDGYVAGAGCAVQEDCNDQNAAIHPGATEVCNGWDDNCDGVIDEGCPTACPNFGLTRRLRVTTGGSEGRIVAADRSWAMIVNSNLSAFPEIATRLDLRGQQLSPQTVFTGGFPKDQEVCWTGTEMTSAWKVFVSSGFPPGVFLRRLGAWGVPSSDATMLTTGNSPFFSELIWNGYEYAAFWEEVNSFVTNGEHLSRADAAGSIVGQVRTDTLMDSYDTMAWNSSGYGWVRTIEDSTTHNDDIYFAPLSPTGSQTGPLVRITDHSSQPSPAYAANAVLVSQQPTGRFGVVWSDNRTGTRQLWFALLQPDGTIVTPPGQVQVTHTTKDIGQLYDMAWSGSEFMAVWTNLDSSSGIYGMIDGSRISSSGAVLETAPITTGPNDDEPRIAWNGKSYGLAVESQPLAAPPNVDFVQVDCNCTTDADGDGVLPCGGGDCDDGDPSVGAGKPEICTDGKDNNCDGLVDCNDPTCVQSGSAPLEIGNVRFSSGKTTIAWNADVKATGYDLARGTLGDLRDMQNFLWTGCFLTRTTQTSASDTEDPKPGAGFYYVVRGRAKTCLLGTWGSGLRDGTLHGCP